MAAFDWAVAGVGLVIFLGTVVYAFVASNVPVGVFGGIGTVTALRQLRGYASAGHWTKSQWLLNHIDKLSHVTSAKDLRSMRASGINTEMQSPWRLIWWRLSYRLSMGA